MLEERAVSIFRFEVVRVWMHADYRKDVRESSYSDLRKGRGGRVYFRVMEPCTVFL
jgi:hypothetical protein